MKLRMALTCVLASAVALQPTAAEAGGWWSYIDLGRLYVAPGETFQIREDIHFEDLGAVDPARSGSEPYYAYLVAGLDIEMLERAMSQPYDPGWWKQPPEATRVGTVSLDRWNSNLAWARVVVRIPDTSSGPYWLMLCNAGCEHPLADVVPSKVIVVQDRLTKQLALRLEDLTVRFREKVSP